MTSNAIEEIRTKLERFEFTVTVVCRFTDCLVRFFLGGGVFFFTVSDFVFFSFSFCLLMFSAVLVWFRFSYSPALFRFQTRNPSLSFALKIGQSYEKEHVSFLFLKKNKYFFSPPRSRDDRES